MTGKYSGNPGANEQGLLLKYNGVTNANSNAARWIEVTVDNNNDPDPEGASVRVRTKLSNTTITEQLVIAGASFSNGARIQTAPKLLLQLLSLFNANLREVLEMIYQFEEPFIVDGSKFTQIFGQQATPLPAAIQATVEWWRKNDQMKG